MERYSRSNQSLWFILDLMSLDLHFDGLFDANFIGLINSSIASSNVQHQLIENLPTLFVSILFITYLFLCFVALCSTD